MEFKAVHKTWIENQTDCMNLADGFGYTKKFSVVNFQHYLVIFLHCNLGGFGLGCIYAVLRVSELLLFCGFWWGLHILMEPE